MGHGSLACGSICLVWLTIAPAVSNAQATAQDELSTLLKKGDRIEVSGGGRRTQGFFESLTSDWLTVRNRGTEFRHPANSIERIRRIDSLSNGSLIGLAAGMTAGFIVALNMSPDPQRCPPGLTGLVSQLEGCGDDRNSAFASLAVAGFVTGYFIDARIRKTIYESRRGGASVDIAPVLRQNLHGFAVGVRLRLPGSN